MNTPVQGLEHFALSSAIDEIVFSHLRKQNTLPDLETFANLKGKTEHLSAILVCISLIMNEAELLYIYAYLH